MSRKKFYFDTSRHGLNTETIALAAQRAFPEVPMAVGSEALTTVDKATRAQIEQWIARCGECPPAPPPCTSK